MTELHTQHDDRLLWRVNQEEFSCRLRDAACIKFIRERHGDGAAIVVAALLHQPQGPKRKPLAVHPHEAHPGSSCHVAGEEALSQQTLSHDVASQPSIAARLRCVQQNRGVLQPLMRLNGRLSLRAVCGAGVGGG